MKEFNREEYNSVLWVLSNASPMILNEGQREYFKRAREKTADFYYSQYSDNEIIAVCSALKYYEDMYSSLISGYPDGNTTKIKIKRTIVALSGAQNKMLKVLEKRKNRIEIKK